MNKNKLRFYIHIGLIIYAIVYGILLLSTDWISSGLSLTFVLSFAAIGILSDIVAPKKRNNSENS
ncbi:hypothetical protein [Staphylococcus equorum]|uniref:hypothetical protein n=1 Tax=Staphylococcus equorum TaxID=246432 RepID=UPI0009BE1778|nr:hypothetical protein [Staphylococcus equorum]